MKTLELVLAGVGTIVVIAGLGLLLAFPLMWCWNYVMPYLFNFPVVGWGRAYCILILAGFLFKNISSSSKN